MRYCVSGEFIWRTTPTSGTKYRVKRVKPGLGGAHPLIFNNAEVFAYIILLCVDFHLLS